MSTQPHAQVKVASAPTPTFTPVRTGLLQRCGASHCPPGKCDERRKGRFALQRRSTALAEPTTVPPIVEEVLRSPGQPLDPGTRAFMEPRFGHDFGHVRVHSDAKAAESARAVNALAYTVGRDVVFGAGQSAPGTAKGRSLLAHELTHVVQQRKSANREPSQKIQMGGSGDAYERTAEFWARQTSEIDTVELTEEGMNKTPTSNASLARTMSTSGLLLQRTCAQHPNEAFYQRSKNYCRDSGFTGLLHPRQRCFREVPKRTGYFQCPPGDQVCFDDKGRCHNSADKVSPVESKNADGTCNLHGLCSIGHGVVDVAPWVLTTIGTRMVKAQMDCVETCETQPWYLKGFCLTACSPTFGP